LGFTAYKKYVAVDPVQTAGRMTNSQKLSLGMAPTVILVVAALYFARPMLEPIAIAVLLAFLLSPLVDRLEHWRFGRIGSVVTVMAVCLCLLGGIGWILKDQVVLLADRLPAYQDTIAAKVGNVGRALSGDLNRAFKSVRDISATAPAPSTAESPSDATARPAPMTVRLVTEPPNIIELASQYIVQVLGPIASGALVVIFATFMLIYRQDLRNRLIRVLGRGHLNLTTQALDDASTRISRYLLMQSAVNVSYGLTLATGLWIIGRASAEGHFPSVLLWGLLAAMLRYVPYLGPILGASLPALVSLAVFKSPMVFLSTLCLFFVVEMIVVNVIEPWLYGSSTGLSVMAILAAAVFWTWLWGLPGLILSTPMTACLVVMGKYIPSMEPLNVLLSDEPPLDIPAQFYQRLLAFDQEEAAELVHTYLEHHTLGETFAQVLVPALIMAERDRHGEGLSVERAQFVVESARDLIEEISEATAPTTIPPAPQTAPSRADTIASQPPSAGPVVVCLPAHDEADELVAIMAAVLLGRAGIRAITASAKTLASERIDTIGAEHAAVTLISALPPGAFSHARYLARRAHTQFPDAGLVVGLWSSRMEPDHIRKRLAIDSPLRLADSLDQAVQVVQESLHVAVVAGKK
jgi:predicted PurR-regulated permease PerM